VPLLVVWIQGEALEANQPQPVLLVTLNDANSAFALWVQPLGAMA
jgi:hypothetical protein